MLAYQKIMSIERNQLVYLEISGYQLLPSTAATLHALPDDVYTVQLLEQQVKEQSSMQKEYSVYGQLVANSLLYRYMRYCVYMHLYIVLCVVCMTL